MKHLTRNLISFAIYFSIGTVVFRYGLSHSLDSRLFLQVYVIAVVYFFYNFGIGWYFGKKDYELLPLYDIGFRFHLATFLLFNSITEAWNYFGFLSQFENAKTNRFIAFFWGIFLIFHFILYLYSRKNTIKGINKSEIFE